MNFFSVFGYADVNPLFNFTTASNEDRRKVLAYIPALGTVLGIIRVAEALLTPKMPFSRKIFPLVRGLGEATNFGIMLLLVDFVVTAIREHLDRIQQQKSQAAAAGSSY